MKRLTLVLGAHPPLTVYTRRHVIKVLYNCYRVGAVSHLGLSILADHSRMRSARAALRSLALQRSPSSRGFQCFYEFRGWPELRGNPPPGDKG